MDIYNKLQKALASVRKYTDFKPEIGIVLGSGLGDYGENIKQVAVVDYKDIEGFPVSTVPGHKGRFIFGYVGEKKVVAMQGRVHYYEGYDVTDVVMPARLMGLMGIEKLILTNAAGGVNYFFEPGDLMMLTDHILLTVPNPLIGANIDELGPRFPDMSEVYSKRLQNVIMQQAAKLAINMKQGVYVQLTGPSYETPAEVRMVRILGGDAVGMSTAVEAVAARHMGIEVCGISCITNKGAGMSLGKLDHKEVQETADRIADNFKKLINAVIENM